MNGLEDIKRGVADNALDFAAWLFPSGKQRGAYWHIGDLAGSPGQSLAINLTGEFWGDFRDWATGERGDCIAATMGALGIDFRAAEHVLRERYGLRRPTVSTRPASLPRNPSFPKLPHIERGSRSDLLQLALQRNLSFTALEIASERGNLGFHDSHEGRAWLITDSTRRNVQTRRLDGKPWSWNGKKAWTLRGSFASWPIGLAESKTVRCLALCEGGPDFLAAFHHAVVSGLNELVAPVCMIGAGLRIPAECLFAFGGKNVRIFVHDDPSGREAAQRWAKQLNDVALRVDGFTFDGLIRADGEPVKDLCDLASVGADSWEDQRQAIESCMNFSPEGGS